jgi:hypothetical protein
MEERKSIWGLQQVLLEKRPLVFSFLAFAHAANQ